VPGWKKLMKVYKEEFGSRHKDERPTLLAVVITDGEATDGTFCCYYYVTFTCYYSCSARYLICPIHC
jgi:hypothetical protein